MNLRKCGFPLHSLCSVTALFFVLISHMPSLEAEDDERFKVCSRSFDCGSFKDLSFPFWGVNQPQYCGLEGYKLTCDEFDGRPVISINGQEFLIHEIHQFGRPGNMTLSRRKVYSGTGNEPCPSTLSPLLFQPINQTLVNMSLFRGCSIFIQNPSRRISCSIDSQSTSYLFLMDNETDPRCLDSVQVAVQKKAFEELNLGIVDLSVALSREFDVWYIGYNDYCSKCNKSGGRCGTDQDVPSKFACYCEDRPYDIECRGKFNWLKLVIGLSGYIGGIVIAIIMVICCLRRRRARKYAESYTVSQYPGVFMTATKSDSNMEAFIRNYGTLAPKRYTNSDVKKMTNSYKEKLGRGGYGEVYKGNLPDGQLVAVKVLNASKGNGEEFINEVASISRTSHVNVVTLVGFCLEKNKRALIYEFMPNGSLEKFIFKEHNILGWEKLYHIALGIARGLEYLHRGCNTRILHLDIKPQNILLDEEFRPKISDFGLSKLCTRKDSIVSMLEARGTIGYIAPEVFNRSFGAVSHKSDVYSYGMMVLEMVGGKKSDKIEVSTSSEYFFDWIYRDLEATDELEPQGLYSKAENDTKKKMILVAVWCIQTIPFSRPSINKVIEMLEGCVETLPVPPMPSLSSPPRLVDLAGTSSFDIVSLIE